MSRRRVVVTGMGMLSPLGTDVPSSWQGILAGRSGIGLIEHTDLSAYSTRFGGSVKGFNVEEYLSVKEARKLDLFIQYGLAAGFQAVRNAGLEVTDANRERIGVAMGSGLYEAAFATLVRLYGQGARSAITGITLIVGGIGVTEGVAVTARRVSSA